MQEDNNNQDTIQATSLEDNILQSNQIIDEMENNNSQQTEENKKQATKTLFSFIKSYAFKKKEIPDEEWLINRFKNYPDIWESEEHLIKSAKEIINTIEENLKSQQELDEHLKKGFTLNNWLGKKIEQGAKAQNIDVSEYAKNTNFSLDNCNNAIENHFLTDYELENQNNTDVLLNDNQYTIIEAELTEEDKQETVNFDSAIVGSAVGSTRTANYLNNVDNAINNANQEITNTFFTKDGNISKALNLDGFIAETHHVNEFNLNATQNNSHYRARVVPPKAGVGYTKNGVDIQIVDTDTNKVVRKYQSKYGADAQATDKLFKHGDYRGQRKLVPEGQSQGIKNSTEVIEHDGIKSTPLSKQQAKKAQLKAKHKSEIDRKDWYNSTDKIALAKNIGKQSAIASGIAVGMVGAQVFGKRIWNAIKGEENKPIEEDLKIFVQQGLKKGASAGLITAVSGGLTVAVKQGLLGTALKATPAKNIVNIATVAITGASALIDCAKGNKSASETADIVAKSVSGVTGSIIGAGEGVTLGAVLGTMVLPGVGTAIGGLVGGTVGAIAGNSVANALYEGSKKCVKGAINAVTNTVKKVMSVAGKTLNFLFG